MYGIGVRRPDGGEAHVPDATHAVQDDIERLHAKDGMVRQHARERLVDAGWAAVPALLACLEEPHDQVRWEAARALVEIPDPRAAHALVVALEDENPGVRWLAAQALAAIGREGLPPLLRALLEDVDSIGLREGAHHVLRDLRHADLPPEVHAVREALDGIEPGLTVLSACERALEALGARPRGGA